MIVFEHQANRISVHTGETWTAEADGETYHDTPAHELQQIVSEVAAGEPWRACVQRHYAQSNPWLSRIVADTSRDLFFRQHPLKPGSLVLDIGAGWGQLSLPLARNHTVVALEPTSERLAFIRAAAGQERVADRIAYLQSDYMAVVFENRFDATCCVGVLEWIGKFSREDDPARAQVNFLRKIRQELRPGGTLILGIENRLGLKYLLGARDDHTGVPAVSVYDRALASQKYQAMTEEPLRVFTYTREELAKMLREAGFTQLEFYGAFPDYKLPQLILPLGSQVEAFLRSGQFIEEHDGCDGRPLPFQVELKSHYQSLATLGIASDFVPSFYVVAS